MYIKYMKENYFAGTYGGLLPDARLEKRVEGLMLALLSKGSAVINKSCKSLAEKEGAYRMLVNDSFDYNDLTEGAIRQLKKWEELAGKIEISVLLQGKKRPLQVFSAIRYL
jgi:hypothetical protein